MDDTTHLLLAAGGGDATAFTAFVRATQADVWRFCAHLVDRDAADDLTQGVYVRVAGSMGGFRGDAAARTWLMTIARRVCADHLRAVVRRRRHELPTRPEALAGVPAPQEDPEDDLVATTDLDRLLALLDDDRREAMVLTQVLGMTYAAAAEVAQVPIGTIGSRVARARAELVQSMTSTADMPSPWSDQSHPASHHHQRRNHQRRNHQRRSAPNP